jgi:hypothetical protein
MAEQHLRQKKTVKFMPQSLRALLNEKWGLNRWKFDPNQIRMFRFCSAQTRSRIDNIYS